ncbi:MAG: T9SS type A sorting domain-containing protein, partial [Bacteroidota bacterium]
SGNNLGTIAYYRNSGSNNFVQQTGSNNPFDGIDVGVNAKPQLVDVDVDGDLDLICGRGRGNLLYYQNDGSNNFNLQTGSNNPFIRLDFIAYFAPQLADADRDGDLDLIAGNTKGSLQYFINLPTCFPSSVNNYVDCIDDAFETVDVEDYPNPQLVNVDGDGDLDLIVGVENGTIAYFQNDDSNNFIQQTASSNPFDGIDVGSYAIPQLVNVDGDGDLDLVVGVENGTIAYFQNDGSNNFTQQTASNNPFDGIDVGYHSSPQLVNVDGDGDLDLIVGEYYGTIQYYQNDGSNNFIQQTASNNPFDGIDVGDYSSPQLVNVDGDSDLDLIIGEVDGTILYYQNDGSNNFIQQTGSNNPFENIDVTSFASPQLIDVDGDSDLDLIVGEDDGFIFFFQNTNLSVSASTTNCTNNQGEVELTISSTDTDGPYTISKSFTGSIGAQGTLGATSTLTTGITFPGAYGFEVSIEPYGCKVAAAVATIDGDCVVPTTRLVDAKTYTGTQILEICTADTIISSATVNSAVNLTYTASQIVILKAGFEAQNGSTFRARIGNCSTPPFTDNEIEARTESVQLDDLIDEHTLLSVFPIPASTHLYYKIEQLADVEAIYLFDMLGRLVREERDLDGEIDIADLPNGQYALVLVGEERQVHRLVQKL